MTISSSAPYNSLEDQVGGRLPIRKNWCDARSTDLKPRQKRSWTFRHIHLREKLWNVLLLCLSPCEHYSRVWSPLISPCSGHPGQCPCLWSWFLCMTQSGGGRVEQKKYFWSRIKLLMRTCHTILWNIIIYLARYVCICMYLTFRWRFDKG